MRSIRLSSLNNRSNLIRINWELCERIGAENLSFLYSCGLESWSRSLRLESNGGLDLDWRSEFSIFYHHMKFKPTRLTTKSVNQCMNTCQHYHFPMQSTYQPLFPFITYMISISLHYINLTIKYYHTIRMFSTSTASILHQTSLWSVENEPEYEVINFAFNRLCDSQP